MISNIAPYPSRLSNQEPFFTAPIVSICILYISVSGILAIGLMIRMTSTACAIARALRRALLPRPDIYHHPDTPDGILYRVRHDDDQIGIALFERGTPALNWLGSEVWRHLNPDPICQRYELIL